MSLHRSRLRSAVPLLAACALLTLTACSGPEGSGSDPEELGPLSKYMEALWDGEEWTEERMQDDQRKTEELVAACMAEEGFEYRPQDPTGMIYMSDQDIDWESREFVEQYGFGIVSWPGMDASEEEVAEYVDPNADYVASLTESEQTAYYEALHGPQPTEEELAAAEEDGGVYGYSWETAGCYGSAQQEMQADDGAAGAYEDPEFADLFEAMTEMHAGIYGGMESESPTDPAVQKLEAAWATCLSGKSDLDAANRNDLTQQFYNEYSEIQSAIQTGEEWVEPDPTVVKEFQEREIAAATADFECREETEYDAKLQEILFAAEQKFVDEHQAALDAMLAKYAVKKKS